jgi:hypothetical protein
VRGSLEAALAMVVCCSSATRARPWRPEALIRPSGILVAPVRFFARCRSPSLTAAYGASKVSVRLSAGRRTGAGALRARGRDGFGERRAGLQIRRPAAAHIIVLWTDMMSVILSIMALRLTLKKSSWRFRRKRLPKSPIGKGLPSLPPNSQKSPIFGLISLLQMS